MTKNRVLLVEDSSLSYEALKNRLENAGWEVVWAKDSGDAYYRIAQAETEQKKFDLFAIDLGLPPDEEKSEIGLNLALGLRNKNTSLPILAYTVQGPKSFDYDLVLRKLLAARVSFVFLRPGDDRVSFDTIINFVAAGYVVLSHTPASYLPTSIALTPDPLQHEHWQTLKLLNENKSYQEIADELGYSRDTIQKWINKIKDILSEALFEDTSMVGKTELLMVDEKILIADLVTWYRENHVKYCRD